MKKIISILLIVIVTACFFAGCGNVDVSDTGKLSVVTTIFPEYDWVMNILGEQSADADVTMLLDSGVDLHSYQPTADDIIKISQCDLFVYVGGESDEWVEDALRESSNRDRVVINLIDLLGDSVKEEEIKEGMQAEDGDEAETETEIDEHIWLSLKNAVTSVGAISEALSVIDPENADIYSENASAYITQLDNLDREYRDVTDNANVRTVLFGDRFPFRYLVDDYNLDYYAAFVGCSAESEASFETIAFLAEKVDELGLKAVLTLEGTDHSIAETVVAATEKQSAEILSMDSMQSTTSEDVRNGKSYIDIMIQNLGVLENALK